LLTKDASFVGIDRPAGVSRLVERFGIIRVIVKVVWIHHVVGDEFVVNGEGRRMRVCVCIGRLGRLYSIS
jgi:hypothetical protein